MKVLILNGSPKADGNTAAALGEMEAIFAQEGMEVEVVRVGHLDIRGCVGCATCYKTGKCVFDDLVNQLAEKLREADGLVLGNARGRVRCLYTRRYFSREEPQQDFPDLGYRYCRRMPHLSEPPFVGVQLSACYCGL